ncbi:hypothetical protein NGF75_01120 [Dietzia kunjamensis]|uniref:hypothetical protein n=1 Tax=Dietzia kunjamensis TaxID=322509 RepID=UPI002DBB1971|nr:hypothetical protein [Dietzia kunjamensis]MEB8324585.1 hypothetical protein [Dietzia kunjamensis]
MGEHQARRRGDQRRPVPHLTAEVVAAHEAPPLAELKVDLLVVGAPTHAFGLPRDGTREDAHARGGELIPSGVREWLDAAGPASLAVATFDTHVRHPDLPGHAGKKAAKKLRKLGCHPVTNPETFYVDGYEGPLLAGELERAGMGRRPAPRRLVSRAGRRRG